MVRDIRSSHCDECGRLECECTCGFRCSDCRVNTDIVGEYYMVSDEVWQSARIDSGMLCIGCLEGRLGRRLVRSDFTEAGESRPDERAGPTTFFRPAARGSGCDGSASLVDTAPTVYRS
jgi:hypothetical protein